jgi:GntR family transcriptional regulator of arabinose operon
VQRVCSAKVSILFAPLEFTPAKDAVNNRIVGALDHAGIQIVLLDRLSAPCFSVPNMTSLG